MSYNIATSNIAVRENRLGSITAFEGDLETLAYRSEKCSLKGCERCYSQASCCLSAMAINQLQVIRDVAVVYHAPAGCAAGVPHRNIIARQIAEKAGMENNSVVVCTDLDEKDTVFGAAESLRGIIKKTYDTYKPKAIFVASSCVSGTIGEDIDAIAEEFRDELPVPVVSVRCEGFKSRLWATGFDIASHALLNGVIKPPKEKRPVINFQDFNDSKRTELKKIFGALGLDVQLYFANSTVEELSHLSESTATVAICSTLGTYMGNALEQLYGVPYIKTVGPHGIEGFEAWLRDIGEKIGKSADVERYLSAQREQFQPRIDELKKKLKGLRAVVGAGSGFAYEITRVLREYGIDVVHHLSWHHDVRNDDGEVPAALRRLGETAPKDTKVSVVEFQLHELTNIVARERPDFYLSRHMGSTSAVSKLGIPAIYFGDEFSMFGYEGTLNFAQRILDAVSNKSLVQNLAAHTKPPYTKWWYEQPSDKFYKQAT